MTIREFLETAPPGQQKAVTDLVFVWHYVPNTVETVGTLNLPDIVLHCDTEGSCNKDQMFKGQGALDITSNQGRDVFVHYTCRNCGKSMKTFALEVHLTKSSKGGIIFKFGELPQFGPPNSPKLISMLSDDKELFLKGRRAENQAMGIAAFAYYRRVIEAQKNRIFDKVLQVCRAYDVSEELVVEIEAAKRETQFTKGVECIKQALPPNLFINGHNPLLLLHDALSQELHAGTDEACLEIATDIRVVLAALAQRMAEAVREDATLKESLTRLAKRRSERK